MKDTEKSGLTIREIAELAILCAIMVAGKEAMNSLPNIHPVMLIIILCARLYGKKALYPVAGFVLIEILLYGISIWTVCYLYIWPLYTLAAVMLSNNNSRMFWALFAGICGLLFGLLSAAVTLAISGWHAAVAYWVAGIPYDVLHGVSNFIIVLALQPVLYDLVVRIKNGGKPN